MKSLINISDLSLRDLTQIFEYSKSLKNSFSDDLNKKNIGLIFEKSSTRTRLSFQVAINHLGGNHIDIRYEELNLSRIESIQDTYKMFNLYLDAIVLRTTSHAKFEVLKKYFRKPIINSLSDISHPCQSIADIFTLFEHFNREENISISWFGDCNNVLYSLIEVVGFYESLSLNIFTNKSIYNNSNFKIPNSKKNINIYYDINKEIIANSNCIMTDVYQSMNDKIDKEKELIKFQINSELMKITNDDAVFMHCLPAKIGSEVTEDVITSKKSIILKQAKNRLVTQKGILKWLEL